MAFKTNVVDRKATHPGRVRLTPVSGQANVYDMVRADEPEIEGTPINKVLLDKKADALTSDAVVCVAVNGSDTTGDGSVDRPYLTIQKAFDSIPKMLNGFQVEVHIGAGTYAEAVNIEYFTGGRITLTGAAGAAVKLKGLLTVRKSNVNIENINLTMENSYIYVTESGWLNLVSGASLTCTGAAHGVYARYGSHVCLGGSANFLNTTSSAIRCGENSTMYLFEPTGTGNAVAMYAQGGQVWLRAHSIGATTEYSTAHGGRIYAGAQATAPRY